MINTNKMPVNIIYKLIEKKYYEKISWYQYRKKFGYNETASLSGFLKHLSDTSQLTSFYHYFKNLKIEESNAK